MRITQKAVLRSYLENLTRIQSGLVKEQDTLSTGLRITRPSDDPVMLPTLLRVKQARSETVRYQENVGHAKDWLSASESSIGDTVSALMRLRDLTVSAGSDTLDSSGREALFQEWQVINNELMDLANTRYAGRYLFSGYRTDTAPFSRAGGTVQYQGDSGEWVHQVDDSSYVTANLPGDEVFLGVLQLADKLGPALQGDATGASQLLAELDDQLDVLLGAQAKLGARTNQLETLSDHLTDREISLEDLQSQLEDADLSRVIIRLRESEAAYEAALQTGARLFSNTLLDYLS